MCATFRRGLASAWLSAAPRGLAMFARPIYTGRARRRGRRRIAPTMEPIAGGLVDARWVVGDFRFGWVTFPVVATVTSFLRTAGRQPGRTEPSHVRPGPQGGAVTGPVHAVRRQRRLRGGSTLAPRRSFAAPAGLTNRVLPDVCRQLAVRGPSAHAHYLNTAKLAKVERGRDPDWHPATDGARRGRETDLAHPLLPRIGPRVGGLCLVIQRSRCRRRNPPRDHPERRGPDSSSAGGPAPSSRRPRDWPSE